MWTKIARLILRNRIFLIIVLAILTAFMGHMASKVQMSFDFAKTVPPSDPDRIVFESFRSTFGEDGNLMAVGVLDSSIYDSLNFVRFRILSEEIANLQGVNDVISLPLLKKVEIDRQNKKINLVPLFADEVPSSQAYLDSMLILSQKQKFYSGQIINEENGATLILISISKQVLNTKARITLVNDIVKITEDFSRVTGIETHIAGLPHVRSVTTSMVARELNIFLGLSILITAIILFLFFRSLITTIFPLIVIGVVVVWSLGTISLLGYKITLLTGLIPPIIVVIGIPNCIYLLNKYHYEYKLHQNKAKALSRVISKIGVATFITNLTTAIGFLVLAVTDILVLTEFGIVAGINIMVTFIVSLILIPTLFSFLPDPTERQLKHLEFKFLHRVIDLFNTLIHNHYKAVFGVSTLIVLVSLVGLYQVKAVSFLVDDLPQDSEVQQDLRFFEKHFGGVMPLEIVIDTHKKKGATRLSVLEKTEELENFLSSNEYISYPVSVVSFVKATRQAFYNDNPRFYELPNKRDKAFIFRYLNKDDKDTNLMYSFIDPLHQKMRSSLKMADIGSLKMDSLIHHVINPKIDEIFGETDIDVSVTGTTKLFVKGNRYLIENLLYSLVLAFIIIAIIMGILFRNVRMIIISLIPNIIPLMITGGIMGYAGIPLKPSTALIFGIAFGISVDDSIHYLAKYRQELFASKFSVSTAISKSLQETGVSMIYTSIVLFAGFIIFSGSSFLGTVALGILTSTTLLFAMFTNLILLPSLLLVFDPGKRNKDVHPLIEQVDFPEDIEPKEGESLSKGTTDKPLMHS